MSAIPPCSEIRFLTGIRLKPDYEHTIWWVSAENQFNYFSGKTKHTVRQVQYVREDRNAIKVPLRIADLMDCNYMIMWNPGHENKKYYAFVTGLEYVGETTTMVRFEVDLIQTWYFECELMPCMVEREHIREDVVGANILPEPVPVGPLIDHKGMPAGTELRENVIIATTCFTVTEEGKLQCVGKQLVGKTYSALHYHAFPCTTQGIEQIAALITFDTINPLDNVISIFMAPKFCYERTNKIVNVPKVYDPFNGYTPHNKKLYTYPFNFLRVTAGDCGHKDYSYERFPSGDSVSFYLQGDLSSEPAIVLEAIDYNTQDTMSGYLNDVNDMLILKGYPQCPWGSDMFIAYLSQIASSTVTLVSGGKEPDPLPNNNVTSLAPVYPDMSPLNLDSQNSNGYDRTVVNLGGLNGALFGGKTVRNVSGGNALFNIDRMQFEFINKRITREYAEIIDSFFDRYGYATNAVKVPNRTSRPQWNYVKTADCCIVASLPSDIVTKIQNIYNKGITFWCWGDNVGDYTLDNRPKT